MKNGLINAEFLNATKVEIKNDILDNIALHYGITRAEAYDEVTNDEAEALLDYVTGPMRTAASVIMQGTRIVTA